MKANIVIDATQVMHDIPRTIYGHFIEHLGRCIKDGLWTDDYSDDHFLGGIRRPVLEAVRSIRPALIRYPGGCFADTYHWEDGIGPREKRPTRPNLAWRKFGQDFGPDDNNHFSTDEFLLLCEELGAEPMLTVNVGSGTHAEAAAWVEYTNGSPDSHYGKRRAENGRIDPYNVKLWCIGNELWGPHEKGWSGPWKYAERFIAFSRAMREKDPEIKLIAVGLPTPLGLWNRIVLQKTEPHVDYLSIHYYYPPLLPHTLLLRRDLKRRAQDYYWVLGGAKSVDLYLRFAISSVQKLTGPVKNTPVIFDEWNLWFAHRDVVTANYNLRDGLFCASALNVLQRRANKVPIACIAQMINCLGLIITDKRGTFLTPSAWVFKMYAENAGSKLVKSDSFSEDIFWTDFIRRGHRMPALDVTATLDDHSQTLTVCAVNRHFDNPITADISLHGFEPGPRITSHVLYHDDPFRYNTFDDPQAVMTNTEEIEPEIFADNEDVSFSHEFPPHSLTVMVLQRKD